jgi:hypothetical protein
LERCRDANLEHQRAPSLIDGAFKEAEALEKMDRSTPSNISKD